MWFCSLQQWFEYCSNKKNSCPICKQNCTLKQAGRLYFQSVGDHTTDSLKILGGGCSAHECPELQNEVKRLELKVSTLTSTLEHHQKCLKDVNEEVMNLESRYAVYFCNNFTLII